MKRERVFSKWLLKDSNLLSDDAIFCGSLVISRLSLPALLKIDIDNYFLIACLT